MNPSTMKLAMLKLATLTNAVVLMLLVAIGVAGRLGQPEWAFTPTAAVAIFAGYYFANRWIGLSVPIAVMAISDQWLPAYGSSGVMLVVYAVLVIPVAIGWQLRKRMTPLRIGLFGIIPAVLFWLGSNSAVWLFQDMYPLTLWGLLHCYSAAIPFFRMMLMGDLFYLTLVFGCYSLSGVLSQSSTKGAYLTR